MSYHLCRYNVQYIALGWFYLLLGLQAVSSAPINQDERTFSEAEKYTVKIRTRINYPFIEDSKMSSIGTGFVINRTEGIVLTNAHVIGRSRSQLKVKFKNNEYISAKKLYVDPVLDLAIIKLATKDMPKSAREAKMDCDTSMKSGVPVGAYGHPWNLSFTATRGIISGKPYLGDADWIQTDAPINSGNSGGPLIGLKTGNVVGISSATLSKKETEGLNFALPIRYACKIVDILLKGGDPSPADLGMIFFEVKDNKPLKVAEIYNANASEFKAGDIITGIVGETLKVKNPYHLYHYLRGKSGKVKLNILRDNKKEQVSLKINKYPNMLNRKGIYFSGLIFAPNHYSDNEVSGAKNSWLVHFVDSGSSAETERVAEWDLVYKIDNKPVGSFNEVYAYLKEKAVNNQETALMIKRMSSGKYKLNNYHEIKLLVEDEKIIQIK